MLPLPRRLSRVVFILITAAMLLAMPFQAAASGPSSGKQGSFSITALTSTISVGRDAAFQVSLRNTGTTALTQAHFQGTATGGTLGSPPAGCTIRLKTIVTCNLGKIDPGQTATLLFTVKAPNKTGTINFLGAAEAKPADAKKLLGWEVFVGSAKATVVNDPNFVGGWQPPHTSPITFNTAPLGGGNTQTTSIQVPPVAQGYPVSIVERSGAIECTNHKTIPGFGQMVEMFIANGASFAPNFLTLTMTYNKSVVGDIDAKKVNFVHQKDDGKCVFPPRGCNHKTRGFCFDAKWVGSGSSKQLVITAELPSNRRGKGF